MKTHLRSSALKYVVASTAALMLALDAHAGARGGPAGRPAGPAPRGAPSAGPRPATARPAPGRAAPARPKPAAPRPAIAPGPRPLPARVRVADAPLVVGTPRVGFVPTGILPRVFRPVPPGTIVRSLADERPFWWHGVRFFVRDGVYYLPNPADGTYVVVRPPVGTAVTSLPSDYVVVVIGDDQFYYVDDTWYDAALRVIDVPVGGFIYDLPAGTETVTIGGTMYYQVGDTFYRQITRDHRTAYERVEVVYDDSTPTPDANSAAEHDSRGWSYADSKLEAARQTGQK